MLKEKFEQLVQKAKENKDVLIRVGAAMAGAAVGAAITLAVVHLTGSQEQEYNPEYDEEIYSDAEEVIEEELA